MSPTIHQPKGQCVWGARAMFVAGVVSPEHFRMSQGSSNVQSKWWTPGSWRSSPRVLMTMTLLHQLTWISMRMMRVVRWSLSKMWRWQQYQHQSLLPLVHVLLKSPCPTK